MPGFGDTLKAQREKAGLTQKELADLVGVNQAALSLWEKGKRDPALSHVQKLCTALGVSCDVFFTLPSSPAKSAGEKRKRK